MFAFIRKIRTSRRIARSAFLKALITPGSDDVLYLTTSTYGLVAWSDNQGRQSGIMSTGCGPVAETRLVPRSGGMAASDECEAAALTSAEQLLAAVGWKPAAAWSRCWSDCGLDSWEVEIRPA